MNLTPQEFKRNLDLTAYETPPSSFSNYRLWLLALYDSIRCQKMVSSYSYKQYSADLGLGYGNVSWLLIHGKRKLTSNTTDKIINALNLHDSHSRYLKALVKYNNSKSAHDRQKYLDNLVSIKLDLANDEQEKKVLRFYSHWSHAIIFELVGLEDFKPDPEWIKSILFTPISKKQIVDSLNLLSDLNLIKYDHSLEKHIKVAKNFTTTPNVPSVGVTQFHMKMIELGIKALEEVPADQRDISAVTLSVSHEGQKRIKEEIIRFREYLLYIADQYTDKQQVTEVNFQMFNLTKKD